MNLRTHIRALALGLMTATGAHADTTRTIVYGDTSSNIPKLRTWSGSAWSSASSALDVGSSPRWVVCKACPTRTELIAAICDSSQDLNVMVYNGASWSGLTEFTTDLGTSSDRTYFLAYEQSSGDALVVYRSGSTSSTIYYRTWNGTAWSAQQSSSFPGSGSAKFVKLVPKPGSNEIMCVVLDGSKDISALIWNGSTFASSLLLDSSTNASGTEQFDAAYETNTGRCLISWADNGGGPPSYRIWTGSAWLSAGSLPSIGGKANWIRMASDPVSNKIIALALDGSSDVNAVVWSGSAWGSVLEFETSAPNTDRRNIDVAFEPDGTRALAMYGESSQTRPRYRTFDGASWSSEQNGPDISQDVSVVQFLPAASGREILIGIERKVDGTLCFMRWTGTALADYQTLVSDMGGTTGNECFMLAGSGTSTTPRIVSWQEVAPSTP